MVRQDCLGFLLHTCYNKVIAYAIAPLEPVNAALFSTLLVRRFYTSIAIRCLTCPIESVSKKTKGECNGH